MLIVRSPVRISFGGGGTDLPGYYEQFGGAVLSTSINKYFYTILKKRSDGKIQVISSDLRVTETWKDIARMQLQESDLEIPLAAIKKLECEISVDLFLASEIMAGTGLGSSASVCVGVLKTLATYVDMPLSKHELAETAYDIARNVLKKPVGKQDEYAAAFGGLNFITFDPDGTTHVEPISLSSDMMREFQGKLMLFFTGEAHNSWKLLQEQDQSAKAKTGRAVDSLHEIRALADQMRETLIRGDLRSFGALLHDSWQAKKKISSQISNSIIDKAYDAAIQSGALGGKVTGAGGGGFLLLFCDQDRQDKVRLALGELGIREMAFELDSNGAHVLVSDPFIDGDQKSGMRWIFSPVSES